MTLLAVTSVLYLAVSFLVPSVQQQAEYGTHRLGWLYIGKANNHLGTVRKLADESSWAISNMSAGGDYITLNKDNLKVKVCK